MKKVITKKFSNGQLKYRKTYNDKNSYLEEFWYESGYLKERIEWKNGLKDGVYEKFNESGTLKIRAKYHNGKLHGLYEFWIDNQCGYFYFENGHLVTK